MQSTRGGAEFGLAAVFVVVGSCLLKWPAFRFGPQYAAATGNSLLDGYRRRGRWTLLVFALMTLAICFTTLAAVTVVTVGLLINLVPAIGSLLGRAELPGGPDLQVAWASIMLLGVIGIVLGTGGYRLLERIMKFVMPVLAICTVAAMAIAMPRILAQDWPLVPDVSEGSGRDLLAALVGWMPAPIDIAVWSSLWTLAKMRTDRSRNGRGPILFDFDVGYVGTMVLAVCFVILGAAVMYGSGESFSNKAPEFGRQVVDLYANQLGNWTRPIVATAAFLAMLSTTVTVADGFPRALAAVVAVAFGPMRLTREERDPNVVPKPLRHVIESAMGRSPDGEIDDEPGNHRSHAGGRWAYWIAFILVSTGAGIILFRAVPEDFKRLIDFVTITSFLIAPVLVLFNHLSMTGREVPVSARPGFVWRAWSWLCFLVTLVFALWYLWHVMESAGLFQLAPTSGG